MIYTQSCELSLSSARIWAKPVLESARKDYWLNNTTHSYRELSINSYVHSPRELKLPWHLVAHLYAAHTGHGDFAAYHNRFKHADATITCSCSSLKSLDHALHCTLPSRRLSRIPSSADSARYYFFSTNSGAKEFIKWLNDTKFFSKICLRNSTSL